MSETNDTSNHGSGEVVTFSFVSPTKTEKISYADHKNKLVRALQSHDWFERGILFNTLEKGVIYPIIHMIEDDVRDAEADVLRSDSVGKDLILHQGKYKEIRRMPQRSHKIEKEAPYSSLDRQFRDGPISNAKNCLFIGFKSLDTYFNEVLEDTWADWTGARFVYLNMNDDFGLKTLRFFRRISPTDINLFMYIVFAECSNITTDNRLALLDFVQRFRVDKMSGYLSVYENNDSVDNLTEGVNGIVVSGRRETKDRKFVDHRDSLADRHSKADANSRQSDNNPRRNSYERNSNHSNSRQSRQSDSNPRKNSFERNSNHSNSRQSDSNPRKNSFGRSNDHSNSSPSLKRRSFEDRRQSLERRHNRNSSPGSRQNSRHESSERQRSDRSPDQRDDPEKHSDNENEKHNDRYENSGDGSLDRAYQRSDSGNNLSRANSGEESKREQDGRKSLEDRFFDENGGHESTQDDPLISRGDNFSRGNSEDESGRLQDDRGRRDSNEPQAPFKVLPAPKQVMQKKLPPGKRRGFKAFKVLS